MSGVPASSHGGAGFAQPSQWTIGPNGDLTITLDGGNNPALKLVYGTAGGPDVLQLVDIDGDTQARFDSEGRLRVLDTLLASKLVQVTGDALGNDTIRGVDPTSTTYSGINNAGYLFTKLNAAPADASLAAGQCAVWFDKTNGAAKLMLKGKTTDGTVVAASVALA